MMLIAINAVVFSRSMVYSKRKAMQALYPKFNARTCHPTWNCRVLHTFQPLYSKVITPLYTPRFKVPVRKRGPERMQMVRILHTKT
jgi:hypothetical protein